LYEKEKAQAAGKGGSEEQSDSIFGAEEEDNDVVF